MRKTPLPTSLPAAINAINELASELRQLQAAIDVGTLPAWVVSDALEENECFRAGAKALYNSPRPLKQSDLAQLYKDATGEDIM